MKRTVFLGRTDRPRWNLYQTDGMGRDTYISYNNGGFWTKGLKAINYVPNYSAHPQRTFHSLTKDTPPFRYYSDGSGRDLYITINSGGLKKESKALNQFHLKDFLRTAEEAVMNFKNPMKNGVKLQTHFVTKKEMQRNNELREIQNGMIKRLYTEPLKKKNDMYNASQTYSNGNKFYSTRLREYPNENFEELNKEQRNRVIKNTKDLKEMKGKLRSLSSFELMRNKPAFNSCINFYRNESPIPNLPVPTQKAKKQIPSLNNV